MVDNDSPNFAGGVLTVTITNNASTSYDRIEIKNTGNGAGQIGFSGSTIKYGGVTIGTLSGGTTMTVPVLDAKMRALQTLTSGPTVEIASQPVDAPLGTYHSRLPQAAPVKAAYAGTATLTLSPDTLAAGKYSIEASTPNRLTTTKPAPDVSTTNAAQVNFGY